MTTHSYDVVVVGGGIAGLSAAIAAAESGARVALLDRASVTEAGGNTRYTEAFLRMKSPDEAADGLRDSLLGDVMGHPDPGLMMETTEPAHRRSPLVRAHHVVDPDYVDTFAGRAGETLQWLTTHGIAFDFFPTPFLTTSTTRMAPAGGGLALVETLGDAADRLGVDRHFQSTARSLVIDDDGTVRGVVASTRSGTSTFEGGVVLACGGFQGNAEMTARYLGPGALTTRPVARGGYYNRGEGIQMALEVGAATAGNFSLFHAEPIDPRSGAPEAAIFCFPYGLLVNRNGQRFVDEARGPVDAWYERTTRDIHAQPDGVAWVILDQHALSIPNIRSGIRTDQPPVSATSLRELAARLDIPSDALEATVAAYNDACGDGTFDPTTPDGLSTQGLRPPKSNWARPLSHPPFEAYPIMAANVFTFGGVKTDASARVVDSDGQTIPGLWAAGELTGLYYTNYTGSTSVLRGAVFGRIAGADAAARRLTRRTGAA